MAWGMIFRIFQLFQMFIPLFAACRISRGAQNSSNRGKLPLWQRYMSRQKRRAAFVDHALFLAFRPRIYATHLLGDSCSASL